MAFSLYFQCQLDKIGQNTESHNNVWRNVQVTHKFQKMRKLVNRYLRLWYD